MSHHVVRAEFDRNDDGYLIQVCVFFHLLLQAHDLEYSEPPNYSRYGYYYELLVYT